MEFDIDTSRQALESSTKDSSSSVEIDELPDDPDESSEEAAGSDLVHCDLSEDDSGLSRSSVDEVEAVDQLLQLCNSAGKVIYNLDVEDIMKRCHIWDDVDTTAVNLAHTLRLNRVEKMAEKMASGGFDSGCEDGFEGSATAVGDPETPGRTGANVYGENEDPLNDLSIYDLLKIPEEPAENHTGQNQWLKALQDCIPENGAEVDKFDDINVGAVHKAVHDFPGVSNGQCPYGDYGEDSSEIVKLLQKPGNKLPQKTWTQTMAQQTVTEASSRGFHQVRKRHYGKQDQSQDVYQASHVHKRWQQSTTVQQRVDEDYVYSNGWAVENQVQAESCQFQRSSFMSLLKDDGNLWPNELYQNAPLRCDWPTQPSAAHPADQMYYPPNGLSMHYAQDYNQSMMAYNGQTHVNKNGFSTIVPAYHDPNSCSTYPLSTSLTSWQPRQPGHVLPPVETCLQPNKFQNSVKRKVLERVRYPDGTIQERQVVEENMLHMQST